MTYNAGIPNATDLISVSQGQIKTNFTQLNSQFGIDHVAFNTGSGNGNGFHKQVTIPTPLVSNPTLSGTYGEFYTKSVSGTTQGFFANASTVTQLTGASSISGSGYTTLPGGVLMQWGSGSYSNGNSVPFPVNFPTAVFALQVTINIASTLSAVGYNGYTSGSAPFAGFIFRTSASGGVPISWVAIGN